MSIITKTAAAEVAKNLTKKQAKEIASLQGDLNASFRNFYLSTLPLSVIAAFSSNPEYFKTRSDFQLSGNGAAHENFSTGEQVPYTSYVRTFPQDISEQLILLRNQIETLKAARIKLVAEIEITLMSLRTYKRISEMLPEAVKFLPSKESTAVALNLSDLRAKLQ